MAREKYHFNTSSLKFEKVELSIKARLIKVLTFLSTAMVFATVVIIIAYQFLDSPKEKRLKREINALNLQYDQVNARMDFMQKVLTDLKEKDNNIYRVVFEAEPISDKNRRVNGVPKVALSKDLANFQNKALLEEMQVRIEDISKQMAVQSKSYDNIFSMVKNKNQMLTSIPAIQPIANKNLKMIASGFGYRIHPIYKTVKMHEGLDFTANIGTPVYATGNGIVDRPDGGSGYGNHIVINHDYGYHTLYGHLSRALVKQGQAVQRGQVIGYVGNTGLSSGPHLHYEVWKGKQKVNPINYFSNDLSPMEYEMIRRISAQANQSFD